FPPHSIVNVLNYPAEPCRVFFLYRPDLDRLEWRVSVDSRISFRGATLGRGQGLAGRVWESGQVRQVADYNEWEGQAGVFTGRPERSVIGAPLIWREEFLGVLTISVHRHHTFSAQDGELLRFFADQASVAVHSARLHEQSQRRVQDLTVIHETTRSLSYLRTPEDLAQEIIRILERVLGYDYGAVLLVDRPGEILIPFALSEQGKGIDFVEEDKAYVRSRSVRLGQGITGWVAQHGESVRLGDVREDPRYYSVRTDIRSELCVPLLAEGRVIGVINTETTRLNAYSPADQRLLETVAAQIAIAIQNAYLLEREQTASQELRNLAGYLQTALEDERTRISRLIHDNFGQALTALKFDIFWLGRQLVGGAVVQSKIAAMSGLIDSTIEQVRQLSSELRPGMLDDLGLAAALEWLGEDFARRTDIEVRSTVTDPALEMSPDLATALYRISQEALTNVARHAAASQLFIILQKEDEEWLLEIRDNGRGIDPAAERDTHSLGILGMRERIHPFGGEIAFAGSPGMGTTVRIRVPVAIQGESDR
ncbi:MAG TPA: GAF domain-containing sensor histidine kinase, partial [Caldilineaceae bacterium]|nr:GAF domain-containing sensor histidine kinase [Caldilineaceae bacterium]